jgi:hypothetical protein
MSNAEARYKAIEKERVELKERYKYLTERNFLIKKEDKEEIKTIGRRLTQLTFNQCHILIEAKMVKQD